jgi:hypothetical protein
MIRRRHFHFFAAFAFILPAPLIFDADARRCADRLLRRQPGQIRFIDFAADKLRLFSRQRYYASSLSLSSSLFRRVSLFS